VPRDELRLGLRGPRLGLGEQPADRPQAERAVGEHDGERVERDPGLDQRLGRRCDRLVAGLERSVRQRHDRLDVDQPVDDLRRRAGLRDEGLAIQRSHPASVEPPGRG
jgi:hypothetical protein